MTRQIVIAYWLIPSEPAHSFFQRVINDLARRYDAPAFEARQCKLMGLTPLGLDQSDEFIKTLFVQFAMNAELQQINGIIRQAANDLSQYEVRPHLSLLYKNLAAASRRELAASISVPLSDVTFDTIKAVRCVSPTQRRADVESWQTLVTNKLLV